MSLCQISGKDSIWQRSVENTGIVHMWPILPLHLSIIRTFSWCLYWNTRNQRRKNVTKMSLLLFLWETTHEPEPVADFVVSLHTRKKRFYLGSASFTHFYLNTLAKLNIIWGWGGKKMERTSTALLALGCC